MDNQYHAPSISFLWIFQEREKSEEMERLVKELKELSECTFKPLTSSLPPKEVGCVHIKGLGRHIELQELAKLRRKEQEEWEKKVFFAHVNLLEY
jgi:hypothetical protein